MSLVSLSRRALLRIGGAAGAGLALPDPIAAARTADLAERLREAARKGTAVALPAGQFSLARLDLPDGAMLTGVPGRTVLKLSGVGPLLSARGARRVTLEGLVLDGAGGFVPHAKGLLDVSDVVDLSLRGCVIRRSAARGVNLSRCGGVLAQNRIEAVGDCALHSLDGLGLDIDGNDIRDCDDNGVVIWSSEAGRYDGARVRDNRIEDIRNRSGGNGPYGNGVAIFRAGFVRVERSRIRRCAYSATTPANPSTSSPTTAGTSARRPCTRNSARKIRRSGTTGSKTRERESPSPTPITAPTAPSFPAM